MTPQELLARTSLAEGLRPDQLEVLANRAEIREIAAGEAVLTRDDVTFPLVAILEGDAEVRGMFDQGVGKLKAGALVGEIAFLDRGRRTADVIAKTTVRVAVLPEDMIEWLKQEHPEISAQVLYNLSRVLCSKLRWAQRMIDAGDAVNPPTSR